MKLNETYRMEHSYCTDNTKSGVCVCVCGGGGWMDGCLYCVCMLCMYFISFIFIPWIRTGLQNPHGYGNSHIYIKIKEVKSI